ncbi:hypothetical protein BaRGS_00005385 [Batillaria attramentaria]|uniref:Uncharacterized protein n=1 Tax=Batillaria attramentaria TaxID=370345 RepID=A0ABD0LV14_9CAEN
MSLRIQKLTTKRDDTDVSRANLTQCRLLWAMRQTEGHFQESMQPEPIVKYVRCEICHPVMQNFSDEVYWCFLRAIGKDQSLCHKPENYLWRPLFCPGVDAVKKNSSDYTQDSAGDTLHAFSSC